MVTGNGLSRWRLVFAALFAWLLGGTPAEEGFWDFPQPGEPDPPVT